MPPPDILVVFGSSVRQARLARALSQEALADRCGLHRTYIGAIERGEQNVALRNLVRLARALDVTPSDLLRDVS